jgi:hypothetical protein
METSQDWIFSKACIEQLNEDEDADMKFPGRRKQFISKTVFLMEDITKHLK